MVITRVNSTETDNPGTPSGNKNDARRPRSKRGLYVIIIFIFMFIIFSRREAVETIDCTPDIIASNPDVIMLGAWWCTYCYQAKRYFQQKNIHYCEYDMENTEIGRQLYEEHGGGAVPILLIGEYQLSGFSEQQIETAISLLKKNVE
jgi:glutaredoxin